MTTPHNTSFPKAILYSWPSSVWSTVPQLCLVEKGYSEDEYTIKQVDITKGENFSPYYLKINLNGTIPTLVVPTYETIGEETDTRYRSLRDTQAICDFLDKARSAETNNTISDKPAPTLGPATIEGKATSDEVIALVHSPLVDPNFLNMSARSPEELKVRVSSSPGKTVQARRDALAKYILEARSMAGHEESWEAKIVPFLEDKQVANDMLWNVYNGKVGEDKLQAFFDASRRIWEVEIPSLFEKVEDLIQGPFLLGDQVSLADLHLVSWLTRIVSIVPAKPDLLGLDSLEGQLGGKKIGPQIRTFFAAWTERESFQKVLVPSSSNFTAASGQ